MPAPAAADPRLEELLGWRLAVAGRLMRGRADQAMAAVVPVGAQAVGVLMRLAEGDGITQSDLARLQRVEAPSMCRMLDRLERGRLVERRRDAGDRRAVRVHLTDAGRAAAGAGAAAAARLDDEVFGALGDEDRRRLAALLGRLIGRLGDGASP